MVVVKLVDTEISIAKRLGQLRCARNRAQGIKNTLYHNGKKKTQEEVDIDAVGAEIAFCKWLNIYPDLTTNVRAKGIDCTWRGLTIDIKNTDLLEGRLICRISKELKDADIYVLTIGELPSYNLVGWCYSGELIDTQRIGYLGLNRIPTYILPREMLRSMDTFEKEYA